jgi:antitoxin (DNA-binding transcriptional repressor) of toxin-antitoxin stability system
MNPNLQKVGMREFREHLPQYLSASIPIAITRHGETVGVYIPTRHRQPQQEELDAIKQAAVQLDQLLMSHGITEAQLLSEFRALRERKKR